METRSLILSPEQYSQVSTYDLLCAAEQGFAGIDHRFLHAIVDDPEKAIPDLLHFGLEERKGGRVDLSEDLIQIFRYLRTPRAIPYLIEYFRRNHLDTTIPLISAFQEIGEPAVGPLLDFYDKAGSEEDSDAGFLLGTLGVRDPRILETLVARLKIDPIDAGHCLAAYGDPAAIPAVRNAIERLSDEWMISSLKFCIEELEAGSVRADEPFDLWELYPEESEPYFDLLTAKEVEHFLDSSDADNRFAALDALYNDRIPSRLWDRLLQMARQDPDVHVRGKSWEVLIDGWERDDIRQAMRACLADETASVEERMGALLALSGREGDKPDIHRRILDFYERPPVRVLALEAMVNTQDPRFASYFRKHLDDPNRDVCAKAMLGVGLLGLESEASRLVRRMKHDDELREDALSCYALCAACEPTRPGMRRFFKKIDDLAGGLSPEETEAVKEALNTRAYRDELEPIFGDDGELIIDEPVIAAVKTGRNDPCPCGSGKKYKKCCGG